MFLCNRGQSSVIRLLTHLEEMERRKATLSQTEFGD